MLTTTTTTKWTLAVVVCILGGQPSSVAAQRVSFFSLCGCTPGYYEKNRFLVYSDKPVQCGTDAVQQHESTTATTCERWAVNASDCQPCHVTCTQCQGPLDTDCTACAGGLLMSLFTVPADDIADTGGTEATVPMSTSEGPTEVTASDDTAGTSEGQLTTSPVDGAATADGGDGSSSAANLFTTEELLPTTTEELTRRAFRRARSATQDTPKEADAYSPADGDESSGDVETHQASQGDGTLISMENGEFEDLVPEDGRSNIGSSKGVLPSLDDPSAVQVNKREYPMAQSGEVVVISSGENAEHDDALPSFSTPPVQTATSLLTHNRQDGRQQAPSAMEADFYAGTDTVTTSYSTVEDTDTPTTSLPPTSFRPSSRPRSKPSRRRYTKPRMGRKNNTTPTPTESSSLNYNYQGSTSEAPQIIIIDHGTPDHQAKRFSCVAECPPGTYTDARTNTCEKCNSKCETCVGPTFMDCTRCLGKSVVEMASRKVSTTSKTFTCLSACPSNHFNKSGVCEPCDPICDGCKGPNSTHCIRCQKNAAVERTDNGLVVCEYEKVDKSLASLEIILPLSFVVFLILVTVLICVRWHFKFTTLTKPFATLWIKYIRRNDNNSANNNANDIADLSSLPKTVTTPTAKLRNEYTSDPSHALCAKCGSEKTDDGYELPVPSSSNVSPGSPLKTLTIKSRRNNDPLPPTPDEVVNLGDPDMYINQSNGTAGSKVPRDTAESVAGGSTEPIAQAGTSRSPTRMYIISDNPYSNSEGLYANC